ncbi:hypothetical protein ACIBQ5_13070 [Streptomyces massasporeus]|uniref:hypothetical protein n=1 Tax=Streptomyces massasporeus TaxID=67324 RepID=UPI0037ACA35D
MLRTRATWPWCTPAAGLRVADRLETRPRHSRVRNTGDPFHAARAGEVTSLWRLTAV